MHCQSTIGAWFVQVVEMYSTAQCWLSIISQIYARLYKLKLNQTIRTLYFIVTRHDPPMLRATALIRRIFYPTFPNLPMMAGLGNVKRSISRDLGVRTSAKFCIHERATMSAGNAVAGRWHCSDDCIPPPSALSKSVSALWKLGYKSKLLRIKRVWGIVGNFFWGGRARTRSRISHKPWW